MLIIQVICIIYHGANKENLFYDEFLSFNLANGEYPLLGDNYKDLYNTKIDIQFWLDSTTVSEHEKFDFSNVWKNQELDVHPPSITRYYI